MTLIPETMTAAQTPERGDPNFELVTLPTPTPGPGQVLLRVESAAVNFSDIKRRRGDAYPFETTFPFVPGGEIAGTIVAHGEGVEAPPPGTRVFALAGANGFGGYAQYAVAYASTAIPFPEEVSFDVASVLMIAGCTAKIMLETTARLRPGESLFVPGAAGGVGLYVLQMARNMGAGTIIAGVSSDAKASLARAYGAHHTVDVTQPDWHERVLALTEGTGVDVALESTGAEYVEQTYGILARFGRMIVFGAATGRAGVLSQTSLDALFYDPASNQTLTGFNIGAWFQERPEVAGPALMGLVQDIAAGHLKAPSIEALPLSQARQAHERLEGRQVLGKLVLKPWLG